MRWINAWRTGPGGAAVPILITGLFVAIVLGWSAAQVWNDLLTNTDELNTAERSREMLLLGRGTVHDNFQVWVTKPPLQYWLTTLTLGHFEKPEMAVRIWPLVYAALTAFALGLLAYLVAPNQPWVVLLSNVLLFSSPLFLTQAVRAFLDIGLTFFTTLAIAFAQLARREPRWWMGVAIICWLGALQKNPLILLIWLIILLIRVCLEPSTLRSSWVISSLIFAAVLLVLWPLSQKLIYHESLRKILGISDALDVIGPNRLGTRPYFEIPIRLIVYWPCGLLALLSTFGFCLKSQEKQTFGVREIALLSISVVGLAVLFNFRSVRYVLPVIPWLCLLLGLSLLWIWSSRRTSFRVACVLVMMISMTGFAISRYTIDHRRNLGIILSMNGPSATREMIDQRQRDAVSQKFLAEQIGAFQKPEIQVVIVDAYFALLPPHFYLFYGNLTRPVAYYPIREFLKRHETRPALGVCPAGDFPAVQQKYSRVVIQSQRGNFICWMAPPEK